MNVIFVVIGVIVFALFLLYGYCLKFFLKTENYRILTDSAVADKRFVLLTDLHGNTHGKNNEKLLRQIAGANPDVVCIAGDMTVKSGKGSEEMLLLLEELVKNYPVYYSPGNHEIRMPDYVAYKERVKKLGVFYLENEWMHLPDGYVIGGLDLPEYWYHKFFQKRILTNSDLELIMEPAQKKYEGENVFPVLLAHNPEYFPQYAKWGTKLVLSGHIHGGIARLPFLGGVISPSLRLFPTYDAGLFRENESYMVLSRGLGLHHIRFRFFNRPELSVIDIQKKNR